MVERDQGGRRQGGRQLRQRLDHEGAENIVKTAIDEFGKVDGVVNNAGILRDGTFHKMTSESHWDAVLKVHLTAATTSPGRVDRTS